MLKHFQRFCFVAHNSQIFLPKSRFINNSSPIAKGKYGGDQIEYIKSFMLENNKVNWDTLKRDVLNLQGSVNNRNINAVILKLLVNNKQFDAAQAFAQHVKLSNEDLNLGCTNGLLHLYHELGKEKDLTTEQQTFITETYKQLYKNYKLLDSTTCERLLHALCTIKDWKKALKVLDDIHMSSKPTHSAYSTIISTLFALNKKAEAYKLIVKSLDDNRSLQPIAYEAWINYILRKFKDKNTMLKHLQDICSHIMNNTVIVKRETAKQIEDVFKNLGWDANVTRIRKIDGECLCCHKTLDCLKISQEDFNDLQGKVKDKLIVGSDLFLKTLPQELDRFVNYVKDTAPYDIVLDALNVAYCARNGSLERTAVLQIVVNYFVKRNKKVLLLGRKHMLRWPKAPMSDILSKTCNFFTDDLTQDDPYFITAAILSGSHTDFVSKDLLRGHMFQLKDERSRLVFRRWQWQHQWMVHINKHGRVVVQPPLKFTPCAQHKQGGWHLPIEAEETAWTSVNDGTPDLNSWLCLRPVGT